MEKLKLSKRQVKAVKDSIAHWERDIQAKLKKGILIMDGLEELYGLLWEDDQAEVLCYSFDCPLCKIYMAHDCVLCPYWLKYGMRCDSLHWKKFIDNPCLKTCNGMIKALENILK